MFHHSEYIDVYFQGQPAGRVLLGLQLQQAPGNLAYGNQGAIGGGLGGNSYGNDFGGNYSGW